MSRDCRKYSSQLHYCLAVEKQSSAQNLAQFQCSDKEVQVVILDGVTVYATIFCWVI